MQYFPPYFDGCRPADGGDGKCGSPDGYLKKAVNENWTKSHPDAAAMFKKLSFTTSQIGAMASLVDLDGDEYGGQWLKEVPSKVTNIPDGNFDINSLNFFS